MRAVLGAPIKRQRGIASQRGGSGDRVVLLDFAVAVPAVAGQAFERAVADLVLHPYRPFDPVAQVHIRQAFLGGAADVAEDDVVAKPAAAQGFGFVKAVDHRQSVTLAIGQAGADQPAGHAVRCGPRALP